MTQADTLYCYVHPNRPTTLRCNRCERPICADDAVLTPTGYRCRQCIRDQQKIFDTALWYDYLTTFVSAGVGSAIASALVLLISNFFFGLGVLLLAPGAGAVIGNLVLRFIGHRRSRPLFATAAAGMIAGALPALLHALGLASLLAYLGLLPRGLFAAVWVVVYLFMAVPAAYTQVSGIRIGR